MSGARAQIETQKQKVRMFIYYGSSSMFQLLKHEIVSFFQLQELENLLAQERLHSLEVLGE